MVSYKPYVSFGNDGCSPNMHRIAPKYDYHIKVRTCLFIHWCSSNISRLLQRISSLVPKENSPFKKKILTMLQFDRLLLQRIQALHSLDRTLKILRASTFWSQTKQKFQRWSVNWWLWCCLYSLSINTTRKVMNFRDGFPSNHIRNFKDHFVLVIDSTSNQNAAENCRDPERVGEPRRLEIAFCYFQDHATDSFVLETEGLGLRITRLALLEIISKKIFALQQISYRIALLKHRYFESFSQIMFRLFPKSSLQIKKVNMNCEHWIMIANSPQKISSANTLGEESTVSSGSSKTRWCQSDLALFQRFRCLHETCIFPSIQVPTRKIFRSPRCSCTFV